MIWVYLLGIFFSGVLIWYGSGRFEEATDYLGRRLSEGVKGASLNAIASSMPEVLTGFIFLFYLHGSDGYSGTIGTTAGSAVFNSLLIPALVIIVVTWTGITKSIEVSTKVILRDGLFLLLAEVALIAVINTDDIGVFEGGSLVFIYIVYFIYMYASMTTKPIIKPEMPLLRRFKTRRSWWLLLYATFVMSIGSFALVYFVVAIGESVGLHLMFVSIVLAAAATSVPDTFISVRDGLKGNYNDAIANALGSNIFDICIAHGLPLTLYALFYGDVIMTPSTTTHSVELRVWLLILTTITIMIYLFKKRLGRYSGIVLIGLYGVFLVFIVGRAYDYEWASNLGHYLAFFRE